jgi:heme-degrading protein
MAVVVKKQSISSELAQKMVAAAVAKARELGVSENVAILDDGGNLKAFSRMDGASVPTIEIAQKKAYTALFGARWLTPGSNFDDRKLVCVADQGNCRKPKPQDSELEVPLKSARDAAHLSSSSSAGQSASPQSVRPYSTLGGTW